MKKMCFFLSFLIAFCVAVFTAPAGAQETQLSVAATVSSSGYYAWCVAQAQVVNKYAPGINVTLVGGGRGGIAFAKLVINGTVDWSAMATLSIPYDIYRGEGAFKGKKWEPIRLFFMREVMVYRMYALADSAKENSRICSD